MHRRLLALIAAIAICSPCLADPSTPDAFNLADYKGKVVYLDFWASWCGPCKLSFPFMDRLARRFPAKDLVVITDNLDQDKSKAVAFLNRMNAGLPVMFDARGVLATRFDVSSMPTSVVIDRNGKVRYVHKGFFSDKEDDYMEHVMELVKEKQS